MLDRGMGCSLRLSYGELMGMPWREVLLFRRELQRFVGQEEKAGKGKR